MKSAELDGISDYKHTHSHLHLHLSHEQVKLLKPHVCIVNTDICLLYGCCFNKTYSYLDHFAGKQYIKWDDGIHVTRDTCKSRDVDPSIEKSQSARILFIVLVYPTLTFNNIN